MSTAERKGAPSPRFSGSSTERTEGPYNNVPNRTWHATQRPYFLQDSPKLGNQYLEDLALREILARKVPSHILKEIEPDLIKFGNRVLGDLLQYGRECENNPPKLQQYDAWGRRVDDIQVSPGWNAMKDISAEEGLIAIGYERKQREYSRLYQWVKLYLFCPSTAVFQCPLAMTDGAARLLELWGDKQDVNGPYKHLTSRDPKQFWTSGQWMTERTGGSDVGNSETTATKRADGLYDLTGFKFFTSAITSEMALMLARVANEKGETAQGSKGLSCFFIEIRNKDGALNNITVHKLKHKLGTRAVPTAELELNSSTAKLVGPQFKGVPVIATILNITRIHNAVSMISYMRRAIAVARDYSHRRSVFGKLLSDQPLHLNTLAQVEIQFRGALQFLVEVVILMGKVECKQNTEQEDILLRILTPLLKLYTAKQAIAVTSECLESLGGAGYMEDSWMPPLLRDAQVGSIWEGTTNVLSVDVWRPIKAAGALDVFVSTVQQKLATIKNKELTSVAELISSSLQQVQSAAVKLAQQMDVLETSARNFAFSLARVYMGALLLEQAQWSSKVADIEIAKRWATEQALVLPLEVDDSYIKLSKDIALAVDPLTKRPTGTGDSAVDGLPRARY